MKLFASVVVLCLLFVQTLPLTAAAATLSDNEQEALANWPNWVGSSGTTCDSGGDVTTGTGLPSDTVNAINHLKSDYQKAASVTGVPWQLLAAVHYREAGNDPNEDLQAGNPLGGGGSQAAGYPYGHPATIEQSAEFAAKELISDAASGVVKKPINVPNPNPEAIKDALFGYNGRAQVYAQQAADLGFNPNTQPYEGSPYVMNNYDAKHHNMKIITHDNGGLDGIDTRLGAFVVYVKLGGNEAGRAVCNQGGAVAGDIVKTAINYAWPDYHTAPYITTKPSYAAAISKAQAAGEYVGGVSGGPGIDCGGFVTRVMRDSGADPNYNWGPNDPRQGNTVHEQAYLDAHPAKYQKLGAMTDTSKLQPGDIAINSDHTYIYVGQQPGFNGAAASASVAPPARAPMASTVYFSNGAGSFIWYRLKQ